MNTLMHIDKSHMALERHSVFRPCIDLHNGQVKQIVGGTLSDSVPDALKTNFVARFVSPTLQSIKTC